MLLRWLKTSIAASIQSVIRYSGAVCQINIGLSKAVLIEAREDILLVAAISPQQHSWNKTSGQYRARQTPRVVATPLPPLKEVKIENRWARIAAIAQNE